MSVVAAAARIRESAGSRAQKRRWSELSPLEKATVITVGSIELVLTAKAAVDLYRRPPALVRGPKALWWPAIFVQPVGPIAYLVIGRRPEARTQDL